MPFETDSVIVCETCAKNVSRSLARPNSRLVFVVDVYIFVFKVYSIRKLALNCPETIFYEKMLILRYASTKSTLLTNLP